MRGLGQNISFSFPGFLLNVREIGEKENIPSFSLRSSKFRRLEFVKLRVKVHLLNEGYAHIPKRTDFKEDPRGYLAWIKMTLIVVLWPVFGRFCVLICVMFNMSQKVFKDCLD